MSDIQERISRLTPAQRALFERRLRGAGAAAPQAAEIPRRTDPDTHPLSVEQEQVWFHTQIATDARFYHISRGCRLKGHLDVAVLERAVNEVIRRHENLRTTFVPVNGLPVPVIAPSLTLALVPAEAGGATEEEKLSNLRRLCSAAVYEPFDLTRGPLIRIVLARLGEQEHALLLIIHHIVTDRLSSDVFLREVAALYDAYSHGRPSPLPELPIQYGDFACWQRERLRGELLEEHLSFWKSKLTNLPSLDLPTDRPRPAVQTYRGGREQWQMDNHLWEEFKSLMREEKVTRFVGMLAVYALLLNRYTGREDLLLGSPVSNRDRVETAGLIGYLINMIVLRIDLSGDPTFRELLARVRALVLEALAHQDVPIGRVMQELRLKREASHIALFEALFVYTNSIKGPDASGSELSLTSFNVFYDSVMVDLSFGVDDAEGVCAFLIDYNADLFETETIKRMMGHYLTLLEGAVAGPGRRVGDLSMLTEPERRQLARRDAGVAAGACLHHIFEGQAARTPAAAALTFEGASLSYRELNEQANRLARHLRGLGVGPETLVGICVERSVEMVVGLLGVLKAGGAYLPLDPAYPAGRLRFMLEDAGVSVLLTQERLRDVLPEHTARVLCLDSQWQELAAESAENLHALVTPENLAYVIYTSGSTGQPKGVLVSHANVSRLFDATRRQFDFNGDDVWTMFHSYAFDFSVWEMWGALLHGGRLVVVPYLTGREPEQFYRLLCDEGVTVLNQTPSAFRQLMRVEEEGRDAGESALRLVIFGGEALEPYSLRGWFARRGDERPRLVNMYGITETTVHVTSRPLTAADADRGASMIGEAIPDLQLYVLDARQRVVSVGMAGEIYVGGAGVARGYLHRAGLTAERFVPDHFGGRPGARLYRTGDMGRRTSGGDVEYLGRVDDQVKVRGFRVEPGEVEAALASHDAVRECVVTTFEAGPGDKRLVAYVVPADATTGVSTTELRRHVAQQLPEYMLPSAFVFVESLPLNEHGKVDRRALPPPGEARAEADDGFVAPQTFTEELLAGIWSEVLKVERVGAHDNFFELGGHSLLATQVVSRVRTGFGLELPLAAIFEAPTLAALGQRIDEALRSRHGLAAPPVGPARRGATLPLSFAQQRLWFLSQLSPDASLYNVPFAVRLEGRLNVAALERTLTELVRRHEALRTSFRLESGALVQVVSTAAAVRLPVADLEPLAEELREAEVRRLAAREAQSPFDLAEGPLLRARLLRLGSEEHVLLLTMHHLVSDGWSLNVLARELTALYTAYAEGAQPSLPEPPIQYADFTVWQREWLRGKALERQLEYWKQQLVGAPGRLELPTDRPRPAVQTFSGADYHFRLPESLTAELRALSRREGVTLFMTLLAAWQTLLSRYAGQTDIVVGTPVAGRDRAELEPLVGLFVNTLALRTDLSGDPTFRELLARVREVALGAYLHQDLPFDKLVDELGTERVPGHTPLYQVVFTLDHAPPGTWELPGLNLSSVDLNAEAAKFDLTLSMWETGHVLVGAFNYNTDLFDAATVGQMAEHFVTLLEAVIAQPDRRVAKVALMTEGERRQLLTYSHGVPNPGSAEKCVQDLFNEQAGQTPEAVAVVFGEQRVTYAELNRRADGLARRLRRLGVGPEVVVGVCVGRSIELVVGLLGVLKAGGVFVNLDLTLPPQRLAFMLEDAQPLLLLTQAHLVQELPPFEGEVVCLDEGGELSADEESAPLKAGTRPENLACVYYTSGSTGRPKGVMTAHRGVVNFITFAAGQYGLSDDDVVLQLASLTFDASLRDLIGPLTVGARLVLLGDEEVREPAAVLAAIEGHGVTCLLSVVPARLKSLTDEALSRGRSYAAPRLILSSGEKLPLSLCEAACRAFGESLSLVNLYGPTECTMTQSYYRVGAASVGRESALVGRPIGDTQIYILSEDLDLAPLGVAGEVYIGGAGVTRGYLDRPSLTAAVFIPDPFGAEPGERLYRTGDVGRYLHDGNLELLGRIDGQIKLRGMRVEPGEIEAALRRHGSIREAVVVAREDEPGEKRLVCYLLTEEGRAAPGAEELREFLRGKLPDYMVPSAYVRLDELPRLANGKLNRGALPPPEKSRPPLSQGYVAPRGELEESLAELWRDVLGVEAVGAYDNFFDIGGDSIKGMVLLNRLQERLGAGVPLALIFTAQTVAEMASYLHEHFPDSVANFTRSEPAPGADGAQELTPISRRAVEDGESRPLSFAQERLWFFDRMQPESVAYNIPLAVRLTGALDAAALEQSLIEVIRRHAILRTTFHEIDGQPVQIAGAAPLLEWSVADLSDLPEARREEETQRLLAADAYKPFDLSRGPLLRAAVVRLGESAHALLVTMHHIVSDGWSVGVFVREVATLYGVFVGGTAPPLAELPIQYADYAEWQRQSLTGEVLDAEFDYWRRQLSGAPAVLSLPTDRRRPAVQTFNGARQLVTVPQELAEALKGLSRREGVMLFMTLLAAWQTLLSRYAGQTDIVVGTPVAGRTRAELEPLIGLFVNTLALRTDLSGDPTFRELLKQVRQITLGAFAHQGVPFEMLVRELRRERDLSYAPLVQVMFALQNTPSPSIEAPGLTLGELGVESFTSKFDLGLAMTETPSGLVGSLQYNTDLFDAATAARMAAHFENLLACVAERPEQRLSELTLLGEQERRRLLFDWNETRHEGAAELTLHGLLESQAERSPDKVALVFEGQMTYAELNARANQVARHLLSLGVKPEVRVGLMMERSAEMVIGLLGILKAGGAYVPLDPAQPAQRLSRILEDSRLELVLTRVDASRRLDGYGQKVVRLDEDLHAIAREDTGNVGTRVNPRNLAYVIYTSGSTGRPKGVMVEHRSACNIIESSVRAFAVGGDSRFVQLASLTFDASVLEIFTALAGGASLHLVDADTVRSGHALARVLRAERITHTALPPSLLDVLPESDFPDLRTVVVGGEACGAETAARWAVGRRFYNAYGPTETTIYATLHACAEGSRHAPPIGRPTPNTQIYLLDERLEPVPVGVAAQLYIGGAGVARGYLDRPGLTAEWFIPHPFSAEPGARLYKTGDLARYRPDGTVEFLGRADRQLKIRGHRIEPGEIEAALAEHPSVKEVIVTAREIGPGDMRLVAYVVAGQDIPPDGAALRNFLKDRLPEYMLPSAYVLLSELPLTAHGKYDRGALPAPALTRADASAAYVAPRDQLELQLAQLWEELLQAGEVGVRDDFFELGGHSLLAVRLAARVERALGQRIEPATLFKAPTVELLAGLLRRQAGTSARSPLVPVEPRGSLRPFFCVHPAGGNVLCYRELAQHLGPAQPFYGLQARGLDGEQQPAAEVEAMASDYIDAMQRAQPSGPYLIGGWSMGGLVAFEMSRQLRARGEQVALLALFDPSVPFLDGRADDDLDETALLVNFALHVGLPAHQPAHVPPDLVNLAREDRLAYLVRRAREADLLPPDISLTQIRSLFDVYRANVSAAVRYRPSASPVPLVLFEAAERRGAGRVADEWGRLATRSVQTYEVPGDHFTLLRKPHVSVLAEMLRECLASASD